MSSFQFVHLTQRINTPHTNTKTLKTRPKAANRNNFSAYKIKPLDNTQCRFCKSAPETVHHLFSQTANISAQKD